MAKLWVVLLGVCSWTLSLARDCDWTTEYEHEKRCCKACPTGEYPIKPCSQDSDSECVKCPTSEMSAKDRCFCKDNHLCSDYECSECVPRKRCKPGEYLIRNGLFDFSYLCNVCPNGTYNDAEDSSCKPIRKCDGVGEVFPGNQTHNARCTFPVVTPAVQNPVSKKEAQGEDKTHSFMVACSIVTVLTCLVVIFFAAFQIFKYKMFKKLNKPYTHNIQHPSDSCACKLSKEEMGEKHDLPDDKFDALFSLSVQ